VSARARRLLGPLLLAALGAAPAAGARAEGAWVARVQSPHGEALVRAEDLARYAAARPGRPLGALLDELVDVELLALKARAEGLSARPDAAHARDRAAAWRYLKESFEPPLSAARLPARYVEQATRQNLRLFRHPELREASHVLLTALSPPSADGRPARPRVTPADVALLTPLAARVAEDLRARPVASDEELLARRDLYAAWLPSGYEVRVERLGRFSREGPYVRPFADACFALREPGALTPPFATEFGVHVARVSAVVPALHTPDEALEREVRARLVDEVRALELQRALDAERQRADVWVAP